MNIETMKQELLDDALKQHGDEFSVAELREMLDNMADQEIKENHEAMMILSTTGKAN